MDFTDEDIKNQMVNRNSEAKDAYIVFMLAKTKSAFGIGIYVDFDTITKDSWTHEWSPERGNKAVNHLN